MTTKQSKVSEEKDTSNNDFLSLAIDHLPDWVESLCPSWEEALEEHWPAYSRDMAKNIAKATLGAEKGPTAEIRKLMRARAEELNHSFSKKPAQPSAWQARMSYVVGEVLLKRKQPRDFGYAEVQGIIGQIDLTVRVGLPSLQQLWMRDSVTIPNHCLPEELQDELQWDAEDEKWNVAAMAPAAKITVQEQEVTFRFVLAPSPSNYQKALKSLGLMEPWVLLSGCSTGHGQFGVVSDDPDLCKIVRDQGSAALLVNWT